MLVCLRATIPLPCCSQSFHKKFKLLKFEMRTFNRTQFGGLPAKTKEAFNNLCLLQDKALANPDSPTFEAVSITADRWHYLASVEERFYRQLKVDTCEIFTDPSDIKREVVLHFQRFMQSHAPESETATSEYMRDLLTYRCSPDMAASLSASD
ncbi:unnamed protein product [Microthlaspi erraticum]|uniref:Uncharacterized protein n=1 Tax=Microthlaspi erraticum TaxID=1685480 RepID=A0A6D2L3Z0_9BRAS|nr:unnamed protein product [Microthlaspi erraticum]